MTALAAPYMLVEGLDLAGKTSVCRGLTAQSPQLALRRNSFAKDNPVFNLADGLRRRGDLDGAYRGHLYVAALALDLSMFSPPKRPTIQESTIALRSLCYYRARGMEDLAGAFERLLDSARHPRFDRSVGLTASLEVRRQRLEMRRHSAPHELADDDLAVLVAPDLFLHMEDILIKEAIGRFGALVVDTTNMTTSAAVAAVAASFEENIEHHGAPTASPPAT